MSRKITIHTVLFTCLLALALATSERDVADWKQELIDSIDEMSGFTQQMVDMIFSFGELGFQEIETSRYVTAILRDNGFDIETDISDIPTAWMARWGQGSPVIALGSDIDGIPKASQRPGVAYHDPLVEGAPGHGEGHNSGQAVNVTAALALKRIMEREGLSGTLILWPGVAEELLGSKAYFVRDGYFSDVEAVLFTHVSNNLDAHWGTPSNSSGLVSVEYTFQGESAHSAGSPWRGRSALDAVELMNQAWNYRREHLRLQQRSHYVITNGGDQPNVVPSEASVWYYFREIDYPHIRELFDIGNRIARGAAEMTDTEVSWRVLGTAWPGHFNRPIAEAAYTNIEQVGLPAWSAADQQLARALQKEIGSAEEGLATQLALPPRKPDGVNYGGGSDDIGDVSWNVPTVTIRYPANIPGLPGHHWSNAVAMATPIAHKGSTAGAKVVAMTALDLVTSDDLTERAWTYFREEQAGQMAYIPLISRSDEPATEMNREIMETYRKRMRPFYFDPSRYKTYLEQLGVKYPTVRN